MQASLPFDAIAGMPLECTVRLVKCALLYTRLPATLPFLPLVVLMLEAACVERRSERGASTSPTFCHSPRSYMLTTSTYSVCLGDG